MRISYMIRMTIALIFDTMSCEHYYKKSQRIWEIFLSFPKDSLKSKYLIFFSIMTHMNVTLCCVYRKNISVILSQIFAMKAVIASCLS